MVLPHIDLGLKQFAQLHGVFMQGLGLRQKPVHTLFHQMKQAQFIAVKIGVFVFQEFAHQPVQLGVVAAPAGNFLAQCRHTGAEFLQPRAGNLILHGVQLVLQLLQVVHILGQKQL